MTGEAWTQIDGRMDLLERRHRRFLATIDEGIAVMDARLAAIERQIRQIAGRVEGLGRA